ncbi:MAG: (d)CMP kinase [Gammaproteobacteria bacterium]
MQDIPVVTIDGAGGTGKGTVAHLLASKLGWHLLDSGALYRVLAIAADKYNVAYDAETSLADLALNLDVEFTSECGDGPVCIVLEGQDVTQQARSVECGSHASKIAVLPAVRQALLARQRAFKQAPGLVTDGRDMGTVVFPDAQLKFYFEATLQERAERRYKQLQNQGIGVSLQQILTELDARDQRDLKRNTAPLKPAADAIIIDTTQLTIEEVLQQLLSKVEQHLGW